MKFVFSQLGYLLEQPRAREDLMRLSRLVIILVALVAARALKARGLRVHIVEHAPVVAAKLEDIADAVFVGPAADRDTLEEAGLAQPAVLLTTNDDAINMHETNLEAVHRAGADFVLSYSSLGAESISLPGINVIALQQDGVIHPSPSPTMPLPDKGELFVVGTHDQRQRFTKAFG